MNPTYEIEAKEVQPILTAIKTELIANGYKCRKFTHNNDGFTAKHGDSFARVWVKRQPKKVGITWLFFGDLTDPLHQIGIDGLIETTIVNSPNRNLD